MRISVCRQLMILLTLIAGHVQSNTAVALELTLDKPDKLVGVAPSELSFLGIRLGMTLDEAEKVLKARRDIEYKQTSLTTVSTLSVWSANHRGSQQQLASLIWKSDSPRLKSIVILNPSAPMLSPAFRGLLLFKPEDLQSAPVAAFLGPVTATEAVIDDPKISFRVTRYVFGTAGIHLQYSTRSGMSMHLSAEQ